MKTKSNLFPIPLLVATILTLAGSAQATLPIKCSYTSR